jgi:hypothetical protein
MIDPQPSNPASDSIRLPGWQIPLIAFVAVLLIYACVWFCLTYRFINDPSKAAEQGQFGDAFGAVNALFSALAFAAVASSLYLQGKEISTSIRELVESNKNQRKSNLLNAIDSFNQINQCAAFDPFRILHRPSERAVALQLFSSKLLLAGLIAEDKNTEDDFPSVDSLRLLRTNAIRMLEQADQIAQAAEKFEFDCTPELLRKHDETFQQIATNVLDCIEDDRRKDFISLRIQSLHLARRKTREGLEKPNVSGNFSTNDHAKLIRELSKQYTVVACDITKFAIHTLGFPCEYTVKDFDAWLKDKPPFSDA